MRGMVRALALILVLTFATGAVAHAVQASGMAFEMAMTADGTMPGCTGCDGDDDGHNGAGALTWSPACVAPAAAILGSATGVGVTTAGEWIPLVGHQRSGLPARIAPTPPQPRILNRALRCTSRAG